jgi:DNA-directed RNA polymerase I subunit RPA1
LQSSQLEPFIRTAYTFRKEGYTKIIEYDLGPKQKLQHAANGIRRPDILAMDRAFSHPAMKEPRQTNETTTGPDDSEMEVDEVVYTDSEEEEEGGAGDATASAAQGEQPIVPEPARAASGRVKRAGGRNERLLAPEEVRAHLRRLFRNEATICSLIYARQGPYARTNRDGLSTASADVFFIELMAVPPTRFRPPSKLGEQVFEHPQNELLTKIINTTYRVRDVNESLNNAKDKDGENLSTPADATKLLGQLLELMITLQNDVNSFIDSSKSTTPVRQGKLPIPGVKQGLEKKEGLFRMHMMVINSTVMAMIPR